MNNLPIDEIMLALVSALDGSANVVLQAAPGAGKTTRVPLALLDRPWCQGGKILMLEPRRLAARAAAQRMAQTLGEGVGETVGYRILLDSKVGKNTKIEVITEGILTRRLQRDPALEGVAAVIFDEFHERSLQADLGLALCLDSQAGLREDLRLLVMSATLDVEPVAALMADAPVISSEGRNFPVDIHYLGDPVRRGGRSSGRADFAFNRAVVSAVLQALDEQRGSLLVFLPGEAEIRRVDRLLCSSPLPQSTTVIPLYGALSQTEQDQALRPAPPGVRKVVLATAIAETSLTIEGIEVVIDGGRSREPRFDPQSGMSRLVTETVSLAGATQRAGRAGRLGPGVCYRLWDKAGEGAFRRFRQPEISNADLTPLALDLANWGIRDPAALKWLTAPPEAPLDQARDLLGELGALDPKGLITAHGRQVAQLAMHPRLAHMVIGGGKWGLAKAAFGVAALLSQRDIAERPENGPGPVDLNLRVAALNGETTSLQINRNGLNRARTLVKQWSNRGPKITGENQQAALPAEDHTGVLIALAYPDRVAGRRPGDDGRYHTTNGRGAALAKQDPLSQNPYLAVAEVTGDNREARIRTAANLSLASLERVFGEQITELETAVWDRQSNCVLARRQKKLGALVLSDRPAKTIPKDQITRALCTGIRDRGLDRLPWTSESRQWLQRVRCWYQTTGRGPNLSDEHLLTNLDDWLGPYLHGMTRLEHLKSLDLPGILKSMLDWSAQQDLHTTVPSHFVVASGSRIAIDYDDPSAPALPVKLQEMFGTTETPRIALGQLPLTLHLLSPAGRPLQITQDLAAFWGNAYPQVKAEMKGRYPKHPWPDDPLAATPTRLTKNKKARRD